MKNYRSTKLTAPGYSPTPHNRYCSLKISMQIISALGGIKAILNFNQSLHFRLEAHGFVPIKEEFPNEDFTAFKSDDFHQLLPSGLAALVYNTGAGPASIMLNYYEKPNTKLYLTLNLDIFCLIREGTKAHDFKLKWPCRI